MLKDKTSGDNNVSMRFIDTYMNYVPEIEPEKNKKGIKTLFYNGGCGGIRTRDQLIKSQLRYHCATHPY